MRRLTRSEFRHDPTDKARWQEAAEACGMTLSEFLRVAADAAATGTSLPRPLQPNVVYERMDPVTLRLLRGAVINLNQAVHRGHLTGTFNYPLIETLALEIRSLVQDDLDKLGQSRAVAAG